MKKLLTLLVLFLSLSFLSSTAQAQEKEKKETISPKKFKKLSKKKNTVVIDVRTPEEFAAGHIPGAQLINVQNAGFEEQVKVLDTTKTYLLYCRSGKRSQNALNKMKALGFTKVYHLQGGIENWKGPKEQ
jgi:rhodanese-related sulfurtransferase